jgi:hypothetical protein
MDFRNQAQEFFISSLKSLEEARTELVNAIDRISERNGLMQKIDYLHQPHACCKSQQIAGLSHLISFVEI